MVRTVSYFCQEYNELFHVGLLQANTEQQTTDYLHYSVQHSVALCARAFVSFDCFKFVD